MTSQPSPPNYVEIINTNRVNWPGFLAVILLPIVTVPVATFYILHQGFVWTDLIPFFALYILGGLSITAGYHRYYAHKTYECHPWVQYLYLIFGAATAQNAVLDWASDHRFHHQYSDREGDPYNINKGFWWAHFKWMLYRYPDARPYANAPDLRRDSGVMWQMRNYNVLLFLAGFILPTAIGACFGRPFAGLIWGGMIRTVFFHHCTFTVNSIAHYFGRKTFSETNTARDFLPVAFLTFGEGYHSFHHAFPSDHRIGHAWHHYDPGKWLIRSLKSVGLADRLKVSPNAPK